MQEVAVDVTAFVATFFEFLGSFRNRKAVRHPLGLRTPFPHISHYVQGRYLLVYAARIHDQNKYLVEDRMTPVNLRSAAIHR